MTAKVFRIATLVACILTAGRAFGAGGVCPSGANYINSSTESQSTLSSLGVTQCFYIAANGVDTNTGTDESHPWAHAPGMPNCSGNCATVQNAFNGSPAGTGFVFRGGDTWHFGNPGAAPYTGGTWVTGNNLNGTLGNPYYIGVDKSWFTGASWVRPILTGDNVTSTSTALGPCTYQIGSVNNMVAFDGASHFIFDNFELTGFCQESSGAPNGWDQYITYGSSADMRFYNLYIHGWTHQKFGNPADPQDCSSGVCFNVSIFHGGGHTTPDDVFRYVVIDGSDSDPRAAQACYCDFWDVAYSYIGNQSNVITRYAHLYHDNIYEYWYENGHGNVIESVGDAPGTNAMYNSIFRHINVPNDAGDPMIWSLPDTSTTDYFFNLLMYDIGTMEYFIAGNNNSDTGSYVLFNDTFQSNLASNGISCSATGNRSSLTLANMHYITDGTFISSGSNCNPWIASTVTTQTITNSTATADGYTSTQSYAYSPTSGSSPTVGTGTNKQTFCTVLSSAGLTGAATACQSDTSYGCAYNVGSHTMSCPARTAIARPASAAWSIGAYQFTSAVSSGPNPPTNLSATIQ